MRAFGFGNGGVALVFAAACGGASCVSGSMSTHEGGLESSDSGLGAGPRVPPTDGLPNAAAFADVNVPGDFTQPVSLPPPATTIQGDAMSLIGSWVEVFDGAPCTAQTGMCWHMEIQQASEGAVRGFIYLVPPANPSSLPPVGPFPPATDPNVGYPPAVSPSDYFSLEANLVPGVDYQILDGVVGGGMFSFWFSSIDLWSGWCALQMPYARNVAGRIVYRCVPETASPANIDVGQLDLCSTATDTADCVSAQGFSYPCVCLDDAGTYSGSLPGCGRSVCECSATACHADLRSGEQNVSLAIDEEGLQGMIDEGVGFSTNPISFQRVMP